MDIVTNNHGKKWVSEDNATKTADWKSRGEKITIIFMARAINVVIDNRRQL